MSSAQPSQSCRSLQTISSFRTSYCAVRLKGWKRWEHRGRPELVWCGREEWNPDRSVPLALLEPLLCGSAAEFWSLQGGPAAEDARKKIELGAMRDATEVCGDGLLPLAATIENLDLVITVDTLAAHLAGALGKPAWVLLQHAADWRWMHERSDSPWYPTLRLFRQPAPGDWGGAIHAMRKLLEQWQAGS